MNNFLNSLFCFLDTFGIHLKNAVVEEQVQGIFNKVINSNYYSQAPVAKHPCHTAMCWALIDSASDDVITHLEACLAKQAIKRYLSGECVFLSQKLNKLNYPSSFNDRLKLYRNWSSRPFTKKQPS